MSEKVVVIGGSGFLGSHLADTLTESGYDVTIFDKKVSPWIQESQQMIVGDIQDQSALLEAIKEANYVYHMAGVADLREAARSPQQTIQENIMGSTNVIEACIKEKVQRLLYASTVYVYSHRGSFYRVSKQAVESILENYQETFGLEYTVLRYGSLYGPRAQDWNGLKRFISQAVLGGKVDYPGTGDERREYIHVKDAAKLSVKALEPSYANQNLTLTGTQVLTSKELMKMIEEILGEQIEVEYKTRDVDPDHYAYTPYRFTPKVAKKVIPNEFIDLGQGILNLIEEAYRLKIKAKESVNND